MWCAFDGVIRTDLDCGVTMFVVDETRGLPWRHPNTVVVGQGDKAGLCVCVSVIAGHIGEFLPVAYRQREIDAAYHDLRLWVARGHSQRNQEVSRGTATYPHR